MQKNSGINNHVRRKTYFPIVSRGNTRLTNTLNVHYNYRDYIATVRINIDFKFRNIV